MLQLRPLLIKGKTFLVKMLKVEIYKCFAIPTFFDHGVSSYEGSDFTVGKGEFGKVTLLKRYNNMFDW